MSCSCNNSYYNLPCCCPTGDPTTSTTTTQCLNGEPCEEAYSSDCVTYVGTGLSCYGIVQGQNVTEIIQLLINQLPQCTTTTTAAPGTTTTTTTPPSYCFYVTNNSQTTQSLNVITSVGVPSSLLINANQTINGCFQSIITPTFANTISNAGTCVNDACPTTSTTTTTPPCIRYQLTYTPNVLGYVVAVFTDCNGNPDSVQINSGVTTFCGLQGTAVIQDGQGVLATLGGCTLTTTSSTTTTTTACPCLTVTVGAFGGIGASANIQYRNCLGNLVTQTITSEIDICVNFNFGTIAVLSGQINIAVPGTTCC